MKYRVSGRVRVPAGHWLYCRKKQGIMRSKNRNTFLFLFTSIDMFQRFWSDQSLIYTKLREHFTAKRGEGGFVLLRIVIYFVLFLSVCMSPLAKFQKILCLGAIHWGDVEAWNLCSSPSQRCGNPILLTWFSLFATVSFNMMKFMHKNGETVRPQSTTCP